MPVLTTSERICFIPRFSPTARTVAKWGEQGEKGSDARGSWAQPPSPQDGRSPRHRSLRPPARSPRSRLGPNGTGQTHSKHLSSSSSVLTPDLQPRSRPWPCRHHTAGAVPLREARQGPEQGQEHPGHRGRAPQPPLGPGGLLGLQPHILCPQVGTVTPRAFQQYEPLRAFLCCCGPDRGSQPSL